MRSPHFEDSGQVTSQEEPEAGTETGDSDVRYFPPAAMTEAEVGESEGQGSGGGHFPAPSLSAPAPCSGDRAFHSRKPQAAPGGSTGVCGPHAWVPMSPSRA